MVAVVMGGGQGVKKERGAKLVEQAGVRACAGGGGGGIEAAC